MGKSPLTGELKNQVRSRANNLLIVLELGQCKTLDVIPTIARDSASPTMEAVVLVWLLNVHVARPVGLHLGMGDFSPVRECHKWVRHTVPSDAAPNKQAKV